MVHVWAVYMLVVVVFYESVVGEAVDDGFEGGVEVGGVVSSASGFVDPGVDADEWLEDWEGCLLGGFESCGSPVVGFGFAVGPVFSTVGVEEFFGGSDGDGDFVGCGHGLAGFLFRRVLGFRVGMWGLGL